jgi:sugar phosphate isomerase/epimerase
MDGDVDWLTVMRELRGAGYEDFVISEVDGDRETYTEICRRMRGIVSL